LSTQTQNRWKFVTAIVRGGLGFANFDVMFQGGLNTCDEM